MDNAVNSQTSLPTDVLNALRSLLAVKADLNHVFFEREREVVVILTAYLARENVYMLGLPGTGKTAIVEKALEAVTGAKVFKLLVGALSTPEELFGPFSMTALQQDRFIRKTDGTAADAHVVYLDEMYKAGSAFLNGALGIANERTFDNGGVRVKLPLFTMFGSSNELPKDAELAAFHDRFRLRLWVQPIAQRSNKAELLRRRAKGGHLRTTARMQLEELLLLQEAVNRVEVSQGIIDLLLDIEADLAVAGFSISTRSLTETVHVLQARALLDNRDCVTEDDLEILGDMVWYEPSDRAKVSEVVGKRSNPLIAKAVALLDSAQAQWSAFPEEVTELKVVGRINRALAGKVKEGEELLIGQPEHRTVLLRQAIDQIRAWQAEAVRRTSKASGVIA